MAAQQSLDSFGGDVSLQNRRCLNCERAVRVQAHRKYRNLVIRRGCPECEELAKLIPVDPEPTWLVDGEPTEVPEYLHHEF